MRQLLERVESLSLRVMILWHRIGCSRVHHVNNGTTKDRFRDLPVAAVLLTLVLTVRTCLWMSAKVIDTVQGCAVEVLIGVVLSTQAPYGVEHVLYNDDLSVPSRRVDRCYVQFLPGKVTTFDQGFRRPENRVQYQSTIIVQVGRFSYRIVE